jgi:hypothetical protein
MARVSGARTSTSPHTAAEASGGTVRILSEPGQGTLFLPRSNEPLWRSAEPRSLAPKAEPGLGEIVLVVEDGAMTLSDLRYRVSKATASSAAARRFAIRSLA